MRPEALHTDVGSTVVAWAQLTASRVNLDTSLCHTSEASTLAVLDTQAHNRTRAARPRTPGP